MTKHLADHRAASTGARLRHFLRIARDRTEAVWHPLWRQPHPVSNEARRVAEYTRIERNQKD